MVGTPLTSAQVDQDISSYCIMLRDTCQNIANLFTEVNGQGTGLAVLEAAGYDAGDAQTALNAISYMNTVAEVYFGSAAQTPAYNFNMQLSQYWAGT